MPRAALLLATVAAVAATVPAAQAATRRAPPPRPPGPFLTVDASRPGRAVPPDFLGLSFEVKSVRQIGAYASTGNLPNLLRSLGVGLLRFGGVTSDTQVAWAGNGPLPDWAAVGLRPGDFGGLAALAGETGWRVLLTLNYLHADPAGAAAEAADAHSALGPALAGLAFGNEPDAYPEELLHPEPWNFTIYQQQLQNLRQALAPSELSLPLAGPDAASGRVRLSWVQAEAQGVQPELLTAHFYPLSWCSGFIPGIDDLLSPGVKGGETRRLAQMAAISTQTGIPLRVDETNSVSCGGEPGVSNTFASALWATDFIVRVMAAGLAGINFHGNVANFSGYSPVAAAGAPALASGQLTAQPEWYALLLARQLTGTQPLPTTLHNGGPALSAQAFAAPRGQLKLVLVDERERGTGTRSVVLRVPRRLGAASVIRLTGPTRSATAGVRLGGSAVAADGSWTPAASAAPLPVRRGVAAVPMAPASAVLITLYPRV